jgi:hypothetical protein
LLSVKRDGRASISNALVLYTREPEWSERRLTRLEYSVSGGFSVSSFPQPVVLTWRHEKDALALLADLATDRFRSVRIASNADTVKVLSSILPFAVRLADGTPLWIVQALTAPDGLNGALRFFTTESGSAALIATMAPEDELWRLQAVAQTGDSEYALALARGRTDPGSSRGMFSTTVIRTKVTCAASSPEHLEAVFRPRVRGEAP